MFAAAVMSAFQWSVCNSNRGRTLRKGNNQRLPSGRLDQGDNHKPALMKILLSIVVLMNPIMTCPMAVIPDGPG